MIETRLLTDLRPHPENADIFGDPEESEQFEAVLSSIRRDGIWEPLVIKADGTILAGHLRRLCAERLKLKEVPVRVREEFAFYRDEVAFVIRSNTDRRQLTKGELAMAFKRLRNLPPAEGGTKKRRGRPEDSVGSKNNSSSGGRVSERADQDAADTLGIGKGEARALETVFSTPGVPAELKTAVNRGDIAATPAAKAVRAEVKKQGGAIADAAPLMPAAVKPPRAVTVPPSELTHDQRMADAAKAYDADYRKLFELYKSLHGILSHRPLKSLLGPTEHHQYASVVRDIAVLAWREIESVQGPTSIGKQMTLTVLAGGKNA